MWLKITNNYSPNFNLPKRSKQNIKFIILHYTGMKKESSAIKKLCDEKSNVSAHYFIKKNGNILNLVPDLYEAWHAGISSWKSFKSLNKYSIGIEIQNSGHDHLNENYKWTNSFIGKLMKKLITNIELILKIFWDILIFHLIVKRSWRKISMENFGKITFSKLAQFK